MKPIFTFLFVVTTLSNIQEVYSQSTSMAGMSFHTPTLISGYSKKPGAVYKFPQVIPGVDAHVKIERLVNGATVDNIDETNYGYYDAFQPTVGAAPLATSFVEWRFSFKKANTYVDTTIDMLAITAIDVDGDGAKLKETIEAVNPASMGLDPASKLLLSFDGILARVISSTKNESKIDSSKKTAMVQMNYKGVSSFVYRNGAISSQRSLQVRETSMYFKAFFANVQSLPSRLLSFNAHTVDRRVQVDWTTTDEVDMKEYVVQKSDDAIHWNDVSSVSAKNSLQQNTYHVNDASINGAITYYRLKQINENGIINYSKVIKVQSIAHNAGSIHYNTVFSTQVNFQVNATTEDIYRFEIFDVNGSRIDVLEQKIYKGNNSLSIQVKPTLNKGIYLLRIQDGRNMNIHSSRLVRS